MPHQCVHCSKVYPAGSKVLLAGCEDCGGRFFFYIRDEQLAKLRESPIEIPQKQKQKVEEDIREMAGVTDDDTPVILDIESIRVTGDGKFEIDVVNLFRKDRPLIYKIEEGKYIIDLASTMERNAASIEEIKNPDD